MVLKMRSNVEMSVFPNMICPNFSVEVNNGI